MSFFPSSCLYFGSTNKHIMKVSFRCSRNSAPTSEGVKSFFKGFGLYDTVQIGREPQQLKMEESFNFGPQSNRVYQTIHCKNTKLDVLKRNAHHSW